MVLYGACGASGAPENTIGVPGSMLIGVRVPGGKLGPRTSKGATALYCVQGAADWTKSSEVARARTLSMWRIHVAAQGPNNP